MTKTFTTTHLELIKANAAGEELAALADLALKQRERLKEHGKEKEALQQRAELAER